jgi:hypothetical protein
MTSLEDGEKDYDSGSRTVVTARTACKFYTGRIARQCLQVRQREVQCVVNQSMRRCVKPVVCATHVSTAPSIQVFALSAYCT